MAKKSKYEQDEGGPFQQGDVVDAEERRAKNDPRNDGDDTSKAGADIQSGEPAPGTSPDDGTKYTVVEEGTVINGVYFPYSGAPAGQAMNVYLSETDAAELVRCGVKLNNEDGSPVEAGEDPNAVTEGEGEGEGEEIIT